jgi:hypothetical protein
MVWFPPKKCPEREQAIVDAVRNSDHEPIQWAIVRTVFAGHNAAFLVMADALKINIETKDAAKRDVAVAAVRVNGSARTEQLVADLLDCSLLTAKLADAVWDQADVHIQPCTMVRTPEDTLHMSETAWTIEHNYRINKKLIDNLPAAHAPTENEVLAFGTKLPELAALVSTVGKHWILEEDALRHPGMAVNYGWHFSGITYGGSSFEPCVTGNGRLIQGRGYHHNPDHTDYSQTIVLVQNTCVVDGKQWLLCDLLQDPDLAGLANQSGPMTVLRQT